MKQHGDDARERHHDCQILNEADSLMHKGLSLQNAIYSLHVT
jgi:hypothetical protein